MNDYSDIVDSKGGAEGWIDVTVDQTEDSMVGRVTFDAWKDGGQIRGSILNNI